MYLIRQEQNLGKNRACIAKHTRGFYGQCSSGPGQIFGQDINECEVKNVQFKKW